MTWGLGEEEEGRAFFGGAVIVNNYTYFWITGLASALSLGLSEGLSLGLSGRLCMAVYTSFTPVLLYLATHDYGFKKRLPSL